MSSLAEHGTSKICTGPTPWRLQRFHVLPGLTGTAAEMSSNSLLPYYLISIRLLSYLPTNLLFTLLSI